MVRCLAQLLGEREARERALAIGMDALVQDLVSRKKSGEEDSIFVPGVQVTREDITSAMNAEEL